MKTSMIALCIVATLVSSSVNGSFLSNYMVGALEQGNLEDFDPALIDDYIFGFLKGLRIDQYVTNSTQCVRATENMTIDAYYSFEYLLDNGFGIDTALNVTKSMQDVKPFIKICYSVTGTAFNKMIEHFQSFGSFSNFFKRFFSNAIGKTFALQEIIGKIQEARSEGNYTDVFYQSGRITRILFDIDPERRIEHPKLSHFHEEGDPDQFELLLNFFSAFVNATSVLDDEQQHHERLCREAGYALDEMIKAVPQQFTDEDYEQGIYTIADIFGEFYPVTYNCYQTAVEVTKSAEEYRHIFESPWTLMTNIIYNFGGLYDRGVKMTKCFGAYDATCAGKNLGEIVHIIFFKK